MVAGHRISLTGLFCWVADFGVYLLLVDASRFHVLHLENPDAALLGRKVRLTGQHGGANVIVVEHMHPA